eukprot:4095410-Heterocapsa_arctica.AAC.1
MRLSSTGGGARRPSMPRGDDRCHGLHHPGVFQVPGYCSPSLGRKVADIPSGLVALSKVPAEGWALYVAFCGLLEDYGTKQD